jgi:hypothetical protein
MERQDLMIKMFRILAAVLIATAVFFLFRTDYDDAFVTGVLGICAFFLSIRFSFKERVQERDAERALDNEKHDS